MIPFNKPYLTGNELTYIKEACNKGQLSGDGYFTSKCHEWLGNYSGGSKVLLTPSCTAALELAALLLNLDEGDEIIMPSFTFVSTANAFVLRGAVPVFVDIRADTHNINEALIEQAITRRTKAIVVVHYAGVSCEMDTIKSIATRNHLTLIEDAAQGIVSTYKGRPLGSIGDLGCFSFHETKNVYAGEGGCLIVSNSSYSDRAEIIREKGTNRSRFIRGEVDKYTWTDVGSSYLSGELVSSFLYAQLERSQEITRMRLAVWDSYYLGLKDLEEQGYIKLPVVPDECGHNAHLFYIVLNDRFDRNEFIEGLKSKGVHCPFHYVPLHQSSYYAMISDITADLPITDNTSRQLFRLPLWIGVDAARVIETIRLQIKQSDQ